MEGRAESATAEDIRTHLDTCEPCRLLVANAMRGESAIPVWTLGTGAPRTLPVGVVINRKFRIDRFIARGGMGEVYEAWDLQLGETIALKTIVCTGLDNARLFPRIRAEVQLARRITHPNVCRILEFGIAEPQGQDSVEALPFFTMEYLRGKTLKQHLNRHGRAAEPEVVSLALQILDGLGAVHSAGIVHRDLKPDNVFVVPTDTSQPRAVVMDFGLARSTAMQDHRSGLSSDALVGTPAYMAPEQALGGQPTPAWDIYALGVMVFELLSGDLPFTGNTALAMAMARVRAPAPLLSTVRPDVHPMLEAVVARCLHADPNRRFATADAVRLALVAVQSSPGRRRSQPRAKGRLIASVLCSLAILLTFGMHAWQLGMRTRGRNSADVPHSPLSRVQAPLLPIAETTTTLGSATPLTQVSGADVAPVRGQSAPPELEVPRATATGCDIGVTSQHAVGSVRLPASPTAKALSARISPKPSPQLNSPKPSPQVNSPTLSEHTARQTSTDELAIPAFAQSPGGGHSEGVP